MRKTKAEKRHQQKRKILVLTVFLLAGTLCMALPYKEKIGANIDDVSRLKAKGIVTNLINQTLKEKPVNENRSEKLFLVEKDKDGIIQLVQSNSTLINRIITDFSNELQNKYNKIRAETVDIPYGTILGSPILSQLTFKLKVKIYPLSVAQCEFETEFESEGINQTKYRVYVIVITSAKIIQPFSSSDVKIKNKMLLAETVIIGQVPNSYVKVPKENILDVTEE